MCHRGTDELNYSIAARGTRVIRRPLTFCGSFTYAMIDGLPAPLVLFDEKLVTKLLVSQRVRDLRQTQVCDLVSTSAAACSCSRSRQPAALPVPGGTCMSYRS